MKVTGVYLGLGWLVDEKTRNELLSYTENIDRANDIADHFHRYNTDGKWFFGEILYEIPEGQAKSLETLGVLPAFEDPAKFGLEYGMMLIDCGVSVEEINTSWSNATLYLVHWVDN